MREGQMAKSVKGKRRNFSVYNIIIISDQALGLRQSNEVQIN
jgi:hypothetical protein